MQLRFLAGCSGATLKNFFHAGNDTEGVYYYLRPEYEGATLAEVYKAIHKFFNPNYDGE